MPLNIGTIHPLGNMTPGPPGGADPFAAYDDEPPAPPQQAADPFAAYDDEAPPKKPSRDIREAESAGIGARESISFGAFPAIHGIISAGQSPEERAASDKAYEAGDHPTAAGELASLVKGLGRLGYEHLIAPALGVNPGGLAGQVTGDQSGPATKVYREERDRAREEQESAYAQNPKSYVVGQIGGGLAVPFGGAAKAATTVGRIGQAAKAGAIGGGLYGTGEAISEGQEPLDVAKSGVLGAGTGALFGAGGAGALEGGAKALKFAGRIARGATNADNEAARQVSGSLRADFENGGAGLDRDAITAAQRAGMPLGLVDLGDQRTRDLARLAANNSSEAFAAIERFGQERALEQHPRLAGFIRGLAGRPSDVAPEPQAARFGRMIRESAGGADAAAHVARLREGARRANRPAYQAAYAAGDRDLLAGNSTLEQLTSAPSVKQAMQAAVNKWKDWQVIDGFGGVNPGATSDRGGLLKFRSSGETGVPTFPNLQFWDYTARNLADKAESARRAGKMQAAARFGGLERQLKAELDRVVDE
jgi:hypothetical protein